MAWYRIVLQCDGAPPASGAEGAKCITAGFAKRTWHQNALCSWAGGRLTLSVENDFDRDGRATMDEFSDEITACIAEGFDGDIHVVSVTKLEGTRNIAITADEKIADIAKRLLEDSRTVSIGLWEVAHRVRWELKPTDPAQHKNAALKVVEELLSAGLEAVTFTPAGRNYTATPWPEQNAAYVTGRIASEWEALGRDPILGEICCFNNSLKDIRNAAMTIDERIARIAGILLEESKVDYVGMWELVHQVRWKLTPSDARQQKDMVLPIVKRLLSAGLKAITFVPSNSSAKREYIAVPWPRQDAEYVIERIASEWDALDRDPNPGEICWFTGSVTSAH